MINQTTLYILLAFIFSGQAVFVNEFVPTLLYILAAVCMFASFIAKHFHHEELANVLIPLSLLFGISGQCVYLHSDQIPFIGFIIGCVFIVLSMALNMIPNKHKQYSNLLLITGGIIALASQIYHISENDILITVLSCVGAVGLILSLYIHNIYVQVGSIGLLYLAQTLYIRGDEYALISYILGPIAVLLIN